MVKKAVALLLSFAILFNTLTASSSPAQTPFKIKYNVKDREHFLDKMFEVSSAYYVFAYAMTIFIAPFGHFQRSIEEFMRGFGGSYAIYKKNLLFKTVTLDKLNVLLHFLDDKNRGPTNSINNAFWLWHTLQGEGLLNEQNNIKQGVMADQLYDHISLFYKGLHHFEEITDKEFFIALDQFLSSLGYVRWSEETLQKLKMHRTSPDLINQLLIKYHLISKTYRIKEQFHKFSRDINSYDIINVLNENKLPKSIIIGIIHDLGFVHPEDIKTLPSLVNKKSDLSILSMKRVVNDEEWQNLLDYVWLSQFRNERVPITKITSNLIIRWKLDYIYKQQKNDPLFNIIRLDNQISSEFKKPLMLEIHNHLHIRNDVLRIKGLSFREVALDGFLYLNGIGYMGRSALGLALRWTTLEPENLYLLQIDSQFGLALTSAVSIMSNLIRLTRDIPSYFQSAKSASLSKEVIKHLDDIEKRLEETPDSLKLGNKNEELQKIITFKIVTSTVYQTIKLEKKQFLNRIGIDLILGSKGVAGLITSIVVVLVLVGTVSIAVAPPIGLAYQMVVMASIIPVALLTYDYVEREERLKLSREFTQYLKEEFQAPQNSDDFLKRIQNFKNLFEKDPNLLLNLGMDTHGLKRTRERILYKDYAPWIHRVSSDRFTLFVDNIADYKMAIYSKVDKLNKKNRELPPAWIKAIQNDKLDFRRDTIDQVTILPPKENELEDLIIPPYLPLEHLDMLRVTTIFGHFLEIFPTVTNLYEKNYFLKIDEIYANEHSNLIDPIDIIKEKQKVEKKKKMAIQDIRSRIRDCYRILDQVENKEMKDEMEQVIKEAKQWAREGLDDIPEFPKERVQFNERFPYFSKFMQSYLPAKALYPIDKKSLKTNN